MKTLFVIDPFETLNPKKDTSLALMQEACKRGHDVFVCQISDLSVELGVAKAAASKLQPSSAALGFDKLEPQPVDMGSFQAIFMRKDPPVDAAFVFATHMLERAERQGAVVVNKPQALRDCNEKLFALEFSEFMSPTLVSSDPLKIRSFIAQHKDVIVKPLDGMGGAGIFRLTESDPNTGSILETMLAPKLPIMAQQFVPQISAGDKRVLVVGGQVMPYMLARIPAKGETRGNLAAGGSGVVQPVTEVEMRIAKRIAPVLVEKGLLFVGLDVIGDKLTEINVTSPTCVKEIEAAAPVKICQALFEAVEAEVKLKQGA